MAGHSTWETARVGALVLLVAFLPSISAAQWSQHGSAIAGEAAEDHFGIEVSFSSDGSRVAIAAPHNDGGGSNSGHVRVYEWGGSG